MQLLAKLGVGKVRWQDSGSVHVLIWNLCRWNKYENVHFSALNNNKGSCTYSKIRKLINKQLQY